MKVKLRYLFLVLAILGASCPFYGQITGFHRLGQVLARAPGGVTAQVVPNAKISVRSSTTGLAATIYSDINLTVPINPPLLTADASGQYNYYIPVNYCVDETVTSPGQGSYTTSNICQGSATSGGAGGTNTQAQYNNNGVLGGSLATLDATGNLSTPGNLLANVPNVVNIAAPPYNAVGDGTTDNCTAITNAITAAGTTKDLYVPAGVFGTSCALTTYGSVKGEGKALSTIKALSSMAGALLTSYSRHQHIMDITLDANGLSPQALHVGANAYDVTIERTDEESPLVNGFLCDGGAVEINLMNSRQAMYTTLAGSVGIKYDSCTDNNIVKNTPIGFETGIVNNGGDNIYERNHAYSQPSYGWMVTAFDDFTSGTIWKGNVADTPQLYGFKLRNFNQILIGNTVFNNGTYGTTGVIGVYVPIAGSFDSIIGNMFQGTSAQHLAQDIQATGNITLSGNQVQFVDSISHASVGQTIDLLKSVTLGSASDGQGVSIGTGANASNTLQISGNRASLSYNSLTGAAVLQAGTSKGIDFAVNNFTLGSGTAAMIDPNGCFGVGAAEQAALCGADPFSVTATGVIVDTSTAAEPLQLGVGAGLQTQYMGFDWERAQVGYDNATGNAAVSGAVAKGVEVSVNNASFGAGKSAMFDINGAFCVDSAFTTSQCRAASPFLVAANGDVSILGNVIIPHTVTAPPVGFLKVTFPGTLASTGTGDTLPPLAQAITIVSASAYAFTPPSGCATFPVITLWDVTAASAVATVTLAAATNQYTMTINNASVPAAHVLAYRNITAPVTCGTNASQIIVNAQYH